MRYRSIRRREEELLAKPAAPPQTSSPASAAGQTDPASSLLGLNRTHGNSYVRGLLARRAAPAVMRQPAPGEEKDKAPAAAPTTAPTAAPTAPTVAPGTEAPKTPEDEAKAKEEAKKAADEAEFKLLKGKIADTTVEAYVKHRDEFFGSHDEYLKFAAESDKELTDQPVLRKLVEMRGKDAAQTVFYRWVRKAYHKAGITDVPSVIKGGATKELAEALSKVKKAYGKDFKHGGFNPRPKKDDNYRFRLGTLSEHGTGNAIDIEDRRNPILSKSDWKFIEEVAGKTVDRKESRWDTKPEELWKDIKELNDLFVKNLAGKVEAEKKKREEEKGAAEKPADAAGTAAGETPPKAADKKAKKADAKPKAAKKEPEPIDVVLKGHHDLKQWKDGFFTLEWELVKELHANGFRWGATFSNAIDLHHFELKD